MSLLPSFIDKQVTETVEMVDDIPREYGIDYTTGELTGTIVEGLEAIKVWIWLSLQAERYRYPIYSWDYGIELEQYIGHSYSKEYLMADCKESVMDCLSQNPHIKTMSNFDVNVEGDKLKLSFTVETDLGGIEVNV